MVGQTLDKWGQNPLVSVEAYRDSGPWQPIGKTVHAVRSGEHWSFSYQGGLMAAHHPPALWDDQRTRLRRQAQEVDQSVCRR